MGEQSAGLELSGFAARPDYRVDIHRRRNLVTARFGELLLAETTRSLLVDEQDHGLVFYFPREDLRVELRRDDARVSRCPFKGQATYWRFDGDGDEAVCWSYDDPIDHVARLSGHVAFYQDRVWVRVGVATPAVLGVTARSQGIVTPTRVGE
ncbi:DUF427 domain-containing protein [Nocardia implantans]|uniref:DUF427 domain-containing protein n=1 Tax=Nocardia implantans TaxID=3108168 RepID=A0ABU6AVD9_9NOCA|nr:MULTISPECIES: DUF427 domain-containing protein [unclassified Nocardia]MBF6192389.1 DUF427 domain-containing protein [Nocardia beijingensis]MEA3527708.1 DUF427 domain-containing protein [Nocardia sp. CDC192]MEB3511416.1 DUF427 domain-containing protein [Nocardia sp. CDC186]